jgi:hypothetical protein
LFQPAVAGALGLLDRYGQDAWKLAVARQPRLVQDRAKRPLR